MKSDYAIVVPIFARAVLFGVFSVCACAQSFKLLASTSNLRAHIQRNTWNTLSENRSKIVHFHKCHFHRKVHPTIARKIDIRKSLIFNEQNFCVVSPNRDPNFNIMNYGYTRFSPSLPPHFKKLFVYNMP